MKSTTFELHSNLSLTPRLLWCLISIFSSVIYLGNWFDLRFIKISGLIINGGTLIFPLTFFLTNLITEVYGYKFARFTIWWGFFFNLIFVVYGQVVIALPSPEYQPYNDLFETLVHANNRAVLAGLLSYVCTEPLNSFVMAKLKVELKGANMGPRFLIATLIASIVDSVLFGFIGYYNSLDSDMLFSLIFGMTLFKIFTYILLLPLFIFLARYLKDKERMDVYDKGTQFNLFKLDTHYDISANRYKI